ncbi:hypothetical protein [Clostridium sardiniense]|uniref:hypothetical protein n=1 Tax=Clostridium sardiniense TaxID=29369 RepID=UPI00195AEA9A|nr:hypothetical protein [Clostridium sardiniense]MBM7836031.1 hypothetical protein [Clostridium sardiniense]
MINSEDLIFRTFRKLPVLNINDFIKVQSFKKDRKILIIKKEHFIEIHELGFKKALYLNISLEELEDLLEEIRIREFPTSQLLRFDVHQA